MKTKLLFLSFLLTLTIGYGQINSYHPIPVSDVVWNLNFYNYCFANVTNENYSLSFSGDTLINGQIYQKMISSQIQVISGFCGLNTTLGYKGAIRNDIANKKVFFVSPSGNIEQLLYDFNLEVGDTVVGYFEETISGFPEIVQSIDSVLVGNAYHKRWSINPLYEVYFIEGIGSSYGLIELLPGGNISDLPQRSITCFSLYGTSIYPSSPTYCNIISSVSTHDEMPGSINVFPNPFSIHTTLQTDSYFNDATLRVYNSFGKIVKQIENISGQSITLFRDNLQSGIYYISLSQGGKVIKSEKLVLID